MASANNRHLGLAFLAAVSTGGLVYFGTGLHPWWPLMWFAPIPVLLLSARVSWWLAGLTATVAWILGGMNLWYYFNSALHMPAGTQAVILVVPALLSAATVLLFRALLRRRAYWSAMLAFPAAWVTFEYLSSLVSPHGTAGSLAYSQLNFLPFLQLASVTGPSGMSFVLLLFSSALVVGFCTHKTSSKQAIQIVIVGTGIIAVVLIFGFVRLSLPVSGRLVKVGLIASDLPQNIDVAEDGAATEQLLREYAARAESLAAAGAEVIVIPEKLGVVTDADVKQTDALLQGLADRTGSTLVAGVVDVAGPVEYNQARVYRPQSVPLTYDKHHMLPPFESRFQPGTSLTIMPKPSGTWGVAICKDMDFTHLSRRYGDAGVGLMLVPAWDFNVDRWAHGHLSIMRGVESGFSIARAAKQGYLTVIDNRGRVLAEARSDSSAFATLVAEVPVAHDTTIYLRLGDWFGWLAILIFVFSLVQLYRVRKNLEAGKTQTVPMLSVA